MRRIYVCHSKHDWAVRFARWLPWNPWGDMGNVGYTGQADQVYVNLDASASVKGHCDYFESESGKAWTTANVSDRLAREFS